MSTITATYNVQARAYEFVAQNLAPHYVDIVAGIDSGGQVVPFSDFSYGFSVSNGTEVVASGQWPPAGISFINSDHPVLEVSRAPLVPGVSYTLTVWFRNWGVYIEGQYEFTAPESLPAE